MCYSALGGTHDLVDLFIEDPAVEKLLLRVIDHAGILIKDENIAPGAETYMIAELADGGIIEIDKEHPADITLKGVHNAPAQRDHPFILIVYDILDM
jgi:hypothetical protein